MITEEKFKMQLENVIINKKGGQIDHLYYF